MSNIKNLFKDIISHCKEYGYIFQSSEIYDGLAATYDYGPNGVELKNNIKEYWWKAMVNMNENIVGLDSAIFMHSDTWKASGHIDAFNDPLIDNKDSKKRYRADVLIEDYIQKIKEKNEKDISKAAKRFGDEFNKDIFIKTNVRVLERNKKIASINEKMQSFLINKNFIGLKDLIEELDVKCPVSGTNNWTDVRQFNLMFKTQLGSTEKENSDLYLRPETAQGIFVNYLNSQTTSRQKIPFGIAQIGKAFRNEITTGNFIFRTREFEQMEMEFFCKLDETSKWLEYWSSERMKWFESLGINKEKLRLRAHGDDELAHYSSACYDIEYKFDFGWSELEGIADRGTYDLDQHIKHSGKKLSYFDQPNNEHFVPAVVEASAGVDRAFLTVLADAFTKEEVNGENRTVLKLSPKIAPIKVAVFPLFNKNGMPEISQKVINELKDKNIACFYDAGGSIGKRYRRQDEAGTPFGITIDHDSLDDNTVTLRFRDSMKQERISIEKVVNEIKDLINK